MRKRLILSLAIREVALPIGCFFGESVVTVWLGRTTKLFEHIEIPDVTLTLVGTAISVLLAFRTNAAYARWWEARTLWGAVTNATRSLMRESVAFEYPRSADAERRLCVRVGERLTEFVQALRNQTTTARSQDRATVSASTGLTPNPAAKKLSEISQIIAVASEAKRIPDYAVLKMHMTLSELQNAQGGIERIFSTAMPRAFDLFPVLFVYFYAALLPLALVDQLGLLMPLVSTLVAFGFLVLNRIGTNLEHPFSETPYAVTTNQIVTSIETYITAEVAI